MPSLLLALLFLLACRTPSSRLSPIGGAANPREAIKHFMNAVAAEDLQRLGELWGTSEGAARDRMDRDELEEREIVMLRCLRHDRYEILGEIPSPGGGHAFVVAVTRKEVTRRTNFVSVKGPNDRWYVRETDMNRLKDICLQ